MSIAIIFNPTARGEKAKRLQASLGALSENCTLKPTTGPGAARTLAAEAVREKYETIVAAGGDGTVNEVLNGIGDANGFEQSRLAILPLGTINVFAKELGLPTRIMDNWPIILRGNEMKVDLPVAEFNSRNSSTLSPEGRGQGEGKTSAETENVNPVSGCKPERRYFAQLAGAGLDSRAIELVNWELKKKVGPLAYIHAGFQALKNKVPPIEVKTDNQTERGELILIGSGKFYGGKLSFFPAASLSDGLLHLCIFPKVDLEAMFRCGLGLLTNQMLKQSGARFLSAETFTLHSEVSAPFQLDGDNVGYLPATFSVQRQKLRVIIS